ncbi:MAG: hypothetical protein IPI49_23210 [Myxococcales bacterium]|nr:hypothetical protein [Myxococcales bacterium]
MFGLLGGCRKGTQPTINDSGGPGRVPAGLLELVEVLPETTAAFGYLEFGDALRDVPPVLAEYREAFVDLMDMIKRRWGVDPRKLTGVGMIFVGDEPVLVGSEQAISAAAQPDGLAVARLGKLSAIGSPAAIAALSAAHRDQPRLRVSQPAWIKAALAHAAGQRVVFSMLASRGLDEQDLAELPPAARELTIATLTVGAAGADLWLHSKPGRGDAVRGELEGMLALAKQVLVQQLGALAAAEPASPEALGAVLLKHYGNALLSNLQVTGQGDELSVRMAWHAPVLPRSSVKPGIAQHAIAPREFAVAQIDFGAPVLEYLIAASDVLGAPLDRAALHRELTTGLAAMLGIPRIDPQRLVISTGTQVLFSVHSAIAPGHQPARRLGDSPWVLETAPWGLVISMNPDPSAQGARLVHRTGAPLPLLTSSKAAKGPAFFRMIGDASPSPEPMPIFSMPIRTLELAARDAGIEATVMAFPGQGPELAAMLQQIRTSAVQALEPAYQARAQGTVDEELTAILQVHLASTLAKMTTPTSISGDRLTFLRSSPQPGSSMMIINGLGILSATAIPTFVDYMKKSKSSEAELQLARLQANAKALYLTDAAYPRASAPLTPAVSCCTYPDRKCPVTAAPWATAAWQALDFQLDEPHFFRYQYTSTPTRFVATAVGDLDCDGEEIVYTLMGEVVNGNPAFSLTKPAPNTD